MNTESAFLHNETEVGEEEEACEPLTVSTVGMGDCQAAAKYTQGSVAGSSSALSERRFRFSDKSGLRSLKSSDSCDRGEVAGWGPRRTRVRT